MRGRGSQGYEKGGESMGTRGEGRRSEEGKWRRKRKGREEKRKEGEERGREKRRTPVCIFKFSLE